MIISLFHAYQLAGSDFRASLEAGLGVCLGGPVVVGSTLLVIDLLEQRLVQ